VVEEGDLSGAAAGDGLRLRVLPGALAIARLDGAAPLPDWALAARGPLWAAVRTEAELSIVCAADAVPPGARAQRGRRALEVAGPLDLALTGVLATLAVPLAEAGVPIFAVATYDTDYVLVGDDRLADALAALRGAGHRVDDV
jgi:uncharacterized protein